jgi:hypothetical protein
VGAASPERIFTKLHEASPPFRPEGGDVVSHGARIRAGPGGAGVYTASPRRYGPRLSGCRSPELFPRYFPMKAEIQSVVDEIQQALSLLRRHL